MSSPGIMNNATPSNTPQSVPAPNPALSPLPLSAAQEQQVRELYFKRVRAKCADEVREFATCCTQQPFTATFFCRGQQKAMNSCMSRYATKAEQDAARAEWFATIEQRREERERKEAKRREEEKFWKEWWDKDLQKKPGPIPSASASPAPGSTKS